MHIDFNFDLLDKCIYKQRVLLAFWIYFNLKANYAFTWCIINETALVACWCLLTYGTNISHIKGNSTLVFMHSGIVTGHQLLCDAHAHTVLESQRGTAVLFLFYSLSSFPLFLLFMCLSLRQSYFFSWVPHNLERTSDLILWFPDISYLENNHK